MNISSPTSAKTEAIRSAVFASPTGVIDEASKNCTQKKTINILAPNLDAPRSLDGPPPPPLRDEFVTSITLLSLPPLLPPFRDDEEDEDDGPLTKVADTFDDKERLRQVKFCPWKQEQKCSRDFREKAFKYERDEAVTFKGRHDVNGRVQYQQEAEFNARRSKMFTERAHDKQREEARDFKNLANISRQLHDLDNDSSNSPKSMMIRKRLFDEAMAD